MHTEVPMRTTINLDIELVDAARKVSGLTERTALIHEGLRALIQRESARRLARLGGSEPAVAAAAAATSRRTMILADTSVWIEHLRAGHAELAARLDEGRVVIHPFVVGELALGNLSRRDEDPRVASKPSPRRRSPPTTRCSPSSSGGDLPGSGVGYVDAHLLVTHSASEVGRQASPVRTPGSRSYSSPARGRNARLSWSGCCVQLTSGADCRSRRGIRCVGRG